MVDGGIREAVAAYDPDAEVAMDRVQFQGSALAYDDGGAGYAAPEQRESVASMNPDEQWHAQPILVLDDLDSTVFDTTEDEW